MHPLCVFLLVGPVLRLGVFTPAADPMLRTLQVVNAGAEPVYSVRVGHHATGEWSADLLDATQVIDVGDGRPLRISLEQTCWYDIRAEYRDGHVEEVDGLDLCTAGRLFLKH